MVALSIQPTRTSPSPAPPKHRRKKKQLGKSEENEEDGPQVDAALEDEVGELELSIWIEN